MSVEQAYRFLGWVQPRPGADWIPGPEATPVAALVALATSARNGLSQTQQASPSVTDPSVPLGQRLDHLVRLLSNDAPNGPPTNYAFAAIRIAMELMALESP